ncbi:MAG: cobalamin-binding protein [Armatimonadota bacterium]
MARFSLTSADCCGLVRPAVDAHTLGISTVAQLLHDCGFSTVIGDAAVCEACGTPDAPVPAARIESWLHHHGITVLGFSYRLDPHDGVLRFARLLNLLKRRRLLAAEGGPLRAILFAGLPLACEIIRAQHPEVTAVFCGDETPAETLSKLGLGTHLLPSELANGVSYDADRLAFGQELIRDGEYHAVQPEMPGQYLEYGTADDTLIARIYDRRARGGGPVLRAHVGPYLPDREEAVRLFLDWTRQLAQSGMLDVLSVGTSQLTQSHFGEAWGDLPNGGGVPLNTPDEFAAVWQAARPMLVRTYAGTCNIPALARMYEHTLHIAWHALSLWWFCQIDGRGPHSVKANLHEHLEALRFIAATGKPFEPNVPHHFAFRGADDVTYLVSTVLAARLAKRMGIRYFVLQNMLNTPKSTWGIQDLAKSRVLLHLVRELQDERFQVFLQPRGGLDYFSPDTDKAKAQLAAVTALMDDIEPADDASPSMIHVVGYSEAVQLADPQVVIESVQITRHALDTYRRLRKRGLIDDMSVHPEVTVRTAELLSEAHTVLQAIESSIPDPYTADGLYRIFAEGFLPVPYLWECQEEFRQAMAWQTKFIHGGVRVVGGSGHPITAAERMLCLKPLLPA